MDVNKSVMIYSLAKLVHLENITFGHHVIIDDFVFIVAKMLSEIGNYVHIASFSSITGGGSFNIGNYSTLSSGVRVFTGTENIDGESLLGAAIPEPYRKAIRSHVQIGKHCMIGANTVVLPGVVIPDGVVVGAMSLVLQDTHLRPWSVYAGCPVRLLRVRHKEKILALEADLRAMERVAT